MQEVMHRAAEYVFDRQYFSGGFDFWHHCIVDNWASYKHIPSHKFVGEWDR